MQPSPSSAEGLRLYLPLTPEDVASVAGDIFGLAEALGHPLGEDDLAYFASNPRVLWLYYLSSQLVMLVQIEDHESDPTLGKETAELHGGVHPAYRGLAPDCTRLVLKTLFATKRKVIIKASAANRDVVGFVRRWGFKGINWEGGQRVWRLKRSEFEQIAKRS